MRSLFIFVSFCFLCAFSSKPVFSNEAAPESFRSEIAALREIIGSLQTTVGELKAAVQNQNEVIEKQTIRIQALERDESAPKEISKPEGAPVTRGLSQAFNPDIGVVGAVQAHLTEESEDAEGRDTIALKEVELNFAQYVDPYSRLDAVISLNDNLEAQNTDIEEAYYTRWGLPFGFQGQIGKFRSKIGKQNLLHLDQLPTADFPLVIQDFFGEEGLASSGARLQNWIPNPWDIPVEVTGEILRGNNGRSFSGISRRPIFNTHVKSFFELTDSVNLELGGTVMFGDENIPLVDAGGNSVRPAEGQDRYGVHVFGGDAAFLWNLPENRTLKFQNEIYFQKRSNLVNPNDDPWGFYSLADFRFHPRMSGGIRFDYLEPLGVSEGHIRSTAVSPYLTFWQSEFANFRVQYRHLDPADPAAKSDDAVFLQANFLIGKHEHPVQ